MRVEQLSVFLENKAGRLAEVTGILSQAAINIRALSLADTSDFGVLRLIVNDTHKAKEALKSKGFTVSETEVVAVEVPDKPGGLHNILEIMQKSDMNVEYMYAFVQQSGSNAVMIFRFENVAQAVKVLETGGITVISGEKLYSL
ncbi:MAG: amino acid-binding protein [Desulfobacteraceae bacterium IS3]|nr:MAG: amino acid-binding protein [Desulfobacteraceae bacterium IS3]